MGSRPTLIQTLKKKTGFNLLQMVADKIAAIVFLKNHGINLYFREMNARILAAIYVKVKKIYEDADGKKFLSFPNNSKSYKSSDISALTNLSLNDENIGIFVNTMYEFSRTMNSPVKSIADAGIEGDEVLWDVYDEILSLAEVPNMEEETALTEAYLKAVDYLYTIEDEIKVPKPVLEAYNKYRDLYFKQQEECGNIKLSLSETSSEEESEILTRALDKARENLSDLVHKWQTHGNRAKVEECLQVIEGYSNINPATFLKDLRRSFNKDVDLLNSPDKGYFAPTYMFPSNFFEDEWNTIELTANEIENYFDSASPEIKKMIGCEEMDKLGDEITSVSLEYRSVRIERPWFNPVVFKSNLWRFPKKASMQPISYADEKSLGRFPSYITALLLFRNLKVNYTAKNTNISQTPTPKLPQGFTLTQARTPKDSFSILAYICKKLPDCPNPDPSANWKGGFEHGRLILKQSKGGDLVGKAFNAYISSCYLPYGTEIECEAIPDITNDYVLSGWKINGEDVENTGYKHRFVIRSPKVELGVVWKKSTKISEDSYELSKDRKTLIKWKGSEAFINMNSNSNLLNVKTIGAEAFRGNNHLQHILIGQNVSVIECAAFFNCNSLNMVEIPASVTVIESDAFGNSKSLMEPNFKIAKDNQVYTGVDGGLVEKKLTINVKIIRCLKCGFSAFYETEPHSKKCPCCNANLDSTKSERKVIIKPNFYVPSNVNKHDLTTKIKQRFKNKFFVKDSFKELLANKAEFELIYVPNWLYNVLTSSNYVGLKPIKPSSQEKDSAESTGKEVAYEEVSGTFSNLFNNFAIMANSFDKKISENAPKTSFGEELFSSVSWFELYKYNPKEGTRILKEQLDSSISRSIIEKIGFGSSIKSVVTSYSDITNSLVLYPIWYNLFDYEGKSYKIIIDGNTGSVKAESPKDKKKIFTVIGIIVGVMAVIALLYFLLPM